MGKIKKFILIALSFMCLFLSACGTSSSPDPAVLRSLQALRSKVPVVPAGLKEAVADILSEEIEISSIHIKRGESYLTAIVESPTVDTIFERYEAGEEEAAIEEWRLLRTSIEETAKKLPDSLAQFNDSRPLSFQLMGPSGQVILLSVMKGVTTYDTMERIERRRLATENPIVIADEEVEADTVTELPSKPDYSEPSETYVWIPKSGKRYHCISDCSGMENARYVPISEARGKGLTACPNCY